MTRVGALNISGEVIDLTAAYDLLILDEGDDLHPPLALRAEGIHLVDFLNQPRPILFLEPNPKQALAEE